MDGQMIAAAEKYTIKGFEAPRPITSKAQNEHYTTVLHDLVMRGHLNHKEEEYIELLGLLIETYEDEHYPIRSASPIEVITELMSANALRQKDLIPIFGTPSMVSMVLSGQRPLTVDHIESLSHRFHISPAAFFPATR
jgi:HTH-type transcriptional regulator / antitoxin HigA